MAQTHENARLEALCDGVIAIAITLLILDVGIPTTMEIDTTAEFWDALLKITPQVYAFVLSFIVIFISWVNHHHFLKLVERTSPQWIYFNGFFLLTIVMVPFPTNLLGEYVLTDHAGPSVVLYNAVFVLQSVAWTLMSRSALKGRLCCNEVAERAVVGVKRNSTFGIILNAGFAMLAFWQPQVSAAMTTLFWLYWLVYPMKMAHGQK